MSRLSPLVAPALETADHGQPIAHGFFTRQGGVSQGLYQSLNVGQGSDDRPENVTENRALICAHLRAERLCTAYQIHSPRAVYMGANETQAPEADALVTDQIGLALGVLSADCVPVLFADQTAGVIGAAHAGWRGAHDGVIENVVALMCTHGAHRENITAVVGPAISQAAYEVGPEFKSQFATTYPDDQDLFIASQKPDHAMFDLTGFVMRQVARARVSGSLLDICTYQNEADFFSYRRTTHRREADYGRQMSAICLQSRR
ncbi:MAG: peptidoglycan editing factor PgeF [Parvibaculales bacterium]